MNNIQLFKEKNEQIYKDYQSANNSDKIAVQLVHHLIKNKTYPSIEFLKTENRESSRNFSFGQHLAQIATSFYPKSIFQDPVNSYKLLDQSTLNLFTTPKGMAFFLDAAKWCREKNFLRLSENLDATNTISEIWQKCLILPPRPPLPHPFFSTDYPPIHLTVFGKTTSSSSNVLPPDSAAPTAPAFSPLLLSPTALRAPTIDSSTSLLTPVNFAEPALPETPTAPSISTSSSSAPLTPAAPSMPTTLSASAFSSASVNLEAPATPALDAILPVPAIVHNNTAQPSIAPISRPEVVESSASQSSLAATSSAPLINFPETSPQQSASNPISFLEQSEHQNEHGFIRPHIKRKTVSSNPDESPTQSNPTSNYLNDLPQARSVWINPANATTSARNQGQSHSSNPPDECSLM